jgi:alpha-glucosidase
MSDGYPWWRHAAVYQVYIRSFADGNGDGTGDIAGLRSRLPYLRDLGVDAVWINPWYVSPLHDGGYDVADYRQIDPRFGTLEDATEFIAEAGRHGIRVLVDLVPNHTSWEHRWFQEALAAEPGSPERDRYHFLPGRGADGSEPPNDWQAVFGGSAWEQVPDGEWYLHLFDISQPDLNWQNPEVRAHMLDVLRFWLDRGAAGFGWTSPTASPRTTTTPM